MVDISSQNNKINVTVSSGGNTANTNVTPDYAQYYSEKSKEWATSNKIVDNIDYSSKYYANESKKQADISTAKVSEVIESGNNAVSNIESARDNAITDITNQESLSVDNVNAAGVTQISSINTAGITQVANVNSAGTTQINLAKEQVTLATNQANIATQQATIATNKTSEVVASGNEALNSIDTAKTGAVTDITNLKNTSISDITITKDNAITAITTQETTSKNNVIATGNEQVDRVIATGNNYDNLTHKNITNCLLEVPQRIKLELNDGVLTLKAGSQVIVPNGFEADGTTPKFDYVTVESDLTTVGWATFTGMTFAKSNERLDFTTNAQITSGNSATLSGGNVWYDTVTNTVKRCNDGSTWTSGYSFPICLATSNGSSTTSESPFSSIDQVFNGFGYIGSTVWVDKGVKGLILNGRNADGSLKNIEFTVDRVQVTTNTISDQPNTFGIRSNGLILQYTYLGEYAVPPTAGGAWGLYYNTQEQTFYFNNHGTWKKHQVSLCGKVTYNSSLTITSFNPKLPFRAVDYSDKAEVSGWSMPSNKYINLTLSASGSKYTAPANGYFLVSGNGGSNNAYVDMENTTAGLLGVLPYTTNSNIGLRSFVPASKGDVISISYSNNFGSKGKSLIFVYAQGDK